MSKDIKDFIKYYIGQDVIYEGNKYSLRALNEYDLRYNYKGAFVFCDADDCHWVNASEIKLVLRKLESMSTKESDELNNVMWDGFPDAWEPLEETLKMFLHPWDGEYRPAFPVYVKALNWLRLKGFDCDELIENGLAIDKETLKPTP